MSIPVFEARDLRKEFGTAVALDDVTLTLRGPSIIGLVGRNGAGKTTLLRHIVGLQLPTSGTARTFGASTQALGDDELARLGVVPQAPSFIGWMSVREQLDYLAGFYARWDDNRQNQLTDALELDLNPSINTLSVGTVQKLAIVAALCHHPTLILLDEPVSHLDPIVRDRFLRLVFDLAQDDGATIVISSHILHDVESVVDWIVCLHRGRLTADASLDALKERYVEWRVTARTRDLPAQFAESFVLDGSRTNPRSARLIVDAGAADLAAFVREHDLDVDAAALNLQGLFPALTGERGLT